MFELCFLGVVLSGFVCVYVHACLFSKHNSLKENWSETLGLEIAALPQKHWKLGTVGVSMEVEALSSPGYRSDTKRGSVCICAKQSTISSGMTEIDSR